MRPPCRIKVSTEISERLRHLHPQLERRVWAVLDGLLVEPLTGKVLHDELMGYRSARIGKFRVVSRLVNDLVDVLTIGPRRTVYEEAERLAGREQER